jgi:phage-related protein
MSWLSSLFDFFKDAFTSLLNYVKDVYLFVAHSIYALLDSIATIYKDLVDWIVAGVQWAVTGIGNFVKSIWKSLIAFVNDAIEWLITIAGKIITGIVDIIAKALPILTKSLLSAFGLPLLIAGGIYLVTHRKDNSKGVTHNAT